MKNIGTFLLYFVISIAILVLSVVGINTGNGMDNFVFWFILQLCFTIIFFIAIFVKEIIKPSNDIDANVKNAPEEFKKTFIDSLLNEDGKLKNEKDSEILK